MNIRWALAAGAAIALAVGTIPAITDLTSGRTGTGAGTSSAAACDPNAKPANLDFTLKDMNGHDVTMSSYRGKVILLDFWATWCGPCKIEIPWFVEFQERYRDQGFVVLGISVDDPVDSLQVFAREYSVNYPLLVGRDREEVQDAYGPMWGIPTTFLISREGLICRKPMGLVPKERVENEIQALL
jgi:peroxiredoxin